MVTLQIKGLQKTTLIDYPCKVAATIFVAGCNFRCPFCYNKDLVLNPDSLQTISQDDIIDFLKKRKKWIDGVCISGGEPLIYSDIFDFIKKIKNIGLLVKIDTNGSNPELIKKLIDDKLIDYIAMDIKASLSKYKEASGVDFSIERVIKSIELIKNSKIDCEFRLTAVPLLHNEDDLEKIGRLLENNERFFIQQFRPKNCINKEFEKIKPFEEDKLIKFKNIAEKYIKKVEIRT